MASSAFLPTTKTALTTIKDIICGKVLSGSTSTAVTASGATAIDASLNNVFAVNVTATTTVSISNHLPGQVITFIVAGGGSGNPVMTFGTGFKSTGTLTCTDAATFTISFISNGTSVFQIARSTALS